MGWDTKKGEGGGGLITEDEEDCDADHESSKGTIFLPK